MKEMQKEKYTITVNEKQYTIEAHPLKRLLDVLREDLGLTGTKEGCGEGECGACTVLIDDTPAMSCLIPICKVQQQKVTTIEGLATEQLHPIQEAFAKCGGTQCGFCTPGMILSAYAYMKHPESAKDLREALASNLCRCTGYNKILESVKQAETSNSASLNNE
jgi:carbon-monoxide dehydrogenase small subunit